MSEDSVYMAKHIIAGRKPVDYDRLRVVINDLKTMIRNESDPEIKVILADAGQVLNRLLLR